jgi:uncharacterized membrane protein YgaE (UPF0421/DUF939 family)
MEDLLDTLRQIKQIEKSGLSLAVVAAENEINLASTFPLTFFPQLKKACEIDKILTEKLVSIVDKEATLLSSYQSQPESTKEELLELARKKETIYKLKKEASEQLTKVQKLNQIYHQFELLGKKKSTRKNKHKRSIKK